MGIFSNLFGGAKPGEYPRSISPLRGWTNVGVYEVHGINPKTGRSNKKQCTAITEDAARAWALAAGLSEPILVQEVQSNMATEHQAKAFKRRHIRANLKGYTTADACCLLWRYDDGDTRQITKAEWEAACAAGFPVSALCGPTHYKYVMTFGTWQGREGCEVDNE